MRLTLCLIVLLLACSPVLKITDVNVRDGCEWCVSWETNLESRCKVTYCDDHQCYVSDWSPWRTLHSAGVPRHAKDIIIYVESRDGQVLQSEVKP